LLLKSEGNHAFICLEKAVMKQTGLVLLQKSIETGLVLLQNRVKQVWFYDKMSNFEYV
jgi:hypothetical protein